MAKTAPEHDESQDAELDLDATAKTESAVAPEAEETPLTPEQELEALRDKNLRLMAELRNVQLRAQREKSDALRYAEADFARELLVVADDLERTLDSARTAENVAALTEGVQIVYDHFLKVCKSRGIEQIDADPGTTFDPEFHEAMLQQPSDEIDAGCILQEVARGYQMRERVLRASKVIVSSGPAAG